MSDGWVASLSMLMLIMAECCMSQQRVAVKKSGCTDSYACRCKLDAFYSCALTLHLAGGDNALGTLSSWGDCLGLLGSRRLSGSFSIASPT